MVSIRKRLHVQGRQKK